MSNRPKKNAERDERIVAAYIAGAPIQDLAAEHQVTPSRIYQIAKAAGVWQGETRGPRTKGA